MSELRGDLAHILPLVPKGARVLDVGCGDGALLAALKAQGGIDGRGIELSQDGVNACVARGLHVVQGDADVDLTDYPDGAFDVVILSKTLQATHNPKKVLANLARIGRRVIVTIPNFGHWRVRLALMTTGRMPVTGSLSYAWYETPNIHFCTVKDLYDLTRELDLELEQFVALSASGRKLVMRTLTAANVFADQALFVLKGRA